MAKVRSQTASSVLMASSSSVYGTGNGEPKRESEATDTPISPYAATKKATEVLSHSHAHLFGMPTTSLRIFTAYGPWGRPDMALLKFIEAIEAGRPIDIYGGGAMKRDFTYVDDLVEAIRRLIDVVPGTALTYGQSITDGCIDWDTTVPALNLLADAVAARRNGQRGKFRERSA